MPSLTAFVRSAAPEATTHLNKDRHGYFCGSWRVCDRGTRELFVEQAGRKVTPFDLRVGVYFGDAAAVMSHGSHLERALAALQSARPGLQAIGACPTFTQRDATRDETRYGWGDEELRAWLTGESRNRDLVWLRDLRNGLPERAEVERAISELMPLWQALNALVDC